MRIRIPVLGAIVVAAALVMASSASAAPLNFYELVAPGSPSSSDIILRLDSNDHFDILYAVFDLTGTEASAVGTQTLVIDGAPFDEVNNTGGIALFSGIDDTHWRYDFDSFNPGDSFQFNWDPDIAGSAGYGASVGEQIGLMVTIGTALGEVSGVLSFQRDVLSALIPSPVPEPASVALLGGGLAVLGLRARRRSSRS